MNMKRFGRDAKLIWSDTKRWCGMPLSFTRYYIVEVPGRWIKLFEDKGFLHTQREEVHMFRIDDFSMYQSLSNKMFGVGNIEVYFNDASHQTLTLTRVKNINYVYNILSEYVDKDKKDKRMNYTEFQRK